MSSISRLLNVFPIFLALVECAQSQTLRPTPGPIPFPSCGACGLLKTEVQCSNTFGCLYSQATGLCGNGCLYDTESACSGCSNHCRWVTGVFQACIVKWDFAFDVCFVVDDSQSITNPEWDAIREFFIIGVIEAVTPTTCDLTASNAAELCPAVGIVQFNFDSFVVLPANLASRSPQYATQREELVTLPGGSMVLQNVTRGQSSICFNNQTILEPLPTNWRSVVRSMELGIIRTPRNGGGTFTLRGVSRCVDLLTNTAMTRRRSLSLLVTETDGNPNGPLECFGNACSVCGQDLRHREALSQGDLARFPECGPQFIDLYQAAQILRTNREKIQDPRVEIKNLLVLFKFGVGAVVEVNNVDCLTQLSPPFGRFIRVDEAALSAFVNDPAARQQLVNDVANISNTFCRFQSQNPTASPTSSPTGGPSLQPSRHPSLQPTVSPSEAKTTTSTTTTTTTTTTSPPTQSPAQSPVRSPTRSPSNNPTSRPSLSPTLSPQVMTMSTGRPTWSFPPTPYWVDSVWTYISWDDSSKNDKSRSKSRRSTNTKSWRPKSNRRSNRGKSKSTRLGKNGWSRQPPSQPGVWWAKKAPICVPRSTWNLNHKH